MTSSHVSVRHCAVKESLLMSCSQHWQKVSSCSGQILFHCSPLLNPRSVFSICSAYGKRLIGMVMAVSAEMNSVGGFSYMLQHRRRASRYLPHRRTGTSCHGFELRCKEKANLSAISLHRFQKACHSF